MSTFTFTCPHCNQAIEAQEEWSGQSATCPICDARVMIPIRLEKETPDGNFSSETEITTLERNAAAPKNSSTATADAAPQIAIAVKTLNMSSEPEPAMRSPGNELNRTDFPAISRKIPGTAENAPISREIFEANLKALTLPLYILIVILLFGFCGLTYMSFENTNRLTAIENNTNRLTAIENNTNRLTAIENNTNRGDKSIISYKLINYTWEYPASMEIEFRDALAKGYEPVGYVCQNGIKGGFFLFIKRR